MRCIRIQTDVTNRRPVTKAETAQLAVAPLQTVKVAAGYVILLRLLIQRAPLRSFLLCLPALCILCLRFFGGSIQSSLFLRLFFLVLWISLLLLVCLLRFLFLVRSCLFLLFVLCVACFLRIQVLFLLCQSLLLCVALLQLRRQRRALRDSAPRRDHGNGKDHTQDAFPWLSKSSVHLFPPILHLNFCSTFSRLNRSLLCAIRCAIGCASYIFIILNKSILYKNISVVILYKFLSLFSCLFHSTSNPGGHGRFPCSLTNSRSFAILFRLSDRQISLHRCAHLRARRNAKYQQLSRNMVFPIE